MKAVHTVACLGALVASTIASAGTEECWSRGFRDGWCDARNQASCPDLRAPRAPAPMPGQEGCDDRYVDGYVAGQKAVVPPVKVR